MSAADLARAKEHCSDRETEIRECIYPPSLEFTITHVDKRAEQLYTGQTSLPVSMVGCTETIQFQIEVLEPSAVQQPLSTSLGGMCSMYSVQANAFLPSLATDGGY